MYATLTVFHSKSENRNLVQQDFFFQKLVHNGYFYCIDLGFSDEHNFFFIAVVYPVMSSMKCVRIKVCCVL